MPLYVISTICTNPTNYQSSRGQDRPGAIIDNSGLAFPDVVPRPSAFINKKAAPFPNEREITNKSRRRCSTFGQK